MRYILAGLPEHRSLERLSQDDKDVFMHAAGDIVEELSASGELVGGEGLADASQARSTRVCDGVMTVTNDPFLEAKEALAGYCIVDVATAQRAEAIAARCPHAQRRGMEIRGLLHGGAEAG